MFRFFGVETQQGLPHSFGILVHLSCILFQQVAVDIIPAFRILGERYLVPTRHVAFDKFHPYFTIVVQQMGRFQFEFMLTQIASQCKGPKRPSDLRICLRDVLDSQSLAG